jgi:hypothetical protein
MVQRLAARARETEREGARGRRNWRRQVAPTGQRAREREHAGERAAADRRAGARPGWTWWTGLGRNGFSFSLDFLIPFLFLFSRVLNSKFKLGFKFK